jgi:hypothetical protein
MGYRDEQKKGAPVKTDYFIAKIGQQGIHHKAATKFHEVYGEKPRAIDILLPSTLGQALDVRYKAFRGDGSDEGGVLVAIGQTNFALDGYVGADTITVFDQDGTVREVEIDGLDDPFVAEFGLELYTTFRFQIPKVLGVGTFAEVASKGKETTDNLWLKLRELYDLFGPRVTFAVRPQLILRPARARPVVQTKDGPRRITSTFFALDLYVPESFEEMLVRLAEFNRQLPALGAQAVNELYGGRRELPALLAADTPAEAPADGGNVGTSETPAQQAGGAEQTLSSPAAPPAPGPHDDEPDTGAQPQAFQPPAGAVDEAAKQAADTAGAYIVETGKHSGRTLAQIAADPRGPGWIRWAMLADNHDATPHAKAYARLYLPAEYQEAMAELQTRAQS